MNILQLAWQDNGGATWFYKQALDQYTGHKTRAVRKLQGRLAYPFDVIAPDEAQLKALWKWADLVHLHDGAGAMIEHDWPKRPIIVTYHGSQYRAAPEQFQERCKERGWAWTVSTPDLTRWGGAWIPTPRADLRDDWNPARRFVVAHAPTNREEKGTDLVLAAMALCRGCKLQLIENTTYLRCIRRKLRARVLIDQFRYGYGSNSVEAWAMGMPSVSGVDDEIRQMMLEAWGYLPFARCLPTAKGLADTLERLRQDADYYRRTQERGRAHYEEYHHPEQVARRLVRVYEAVVK